MTEEEKPDRPRRGAAIWAFLFALMSAGMLLTGKGVRDAETGIVFAALALGMAGYSLGRYPVPWRLPAAAIVIALLCGPGNMMKLRSHVRDCLPGGKAYIRVTDIYVPETVDPASGIL